MKVTAEVSGLKDIITSIERDRPLNRMDKTSISHHAKQAQYTLEDRTPVRSGKTANSWSHEITFGKDTVTIDFLNNNLTKYGTPVAILIALGHGTRQGVYIPPNDFISPVMDKFANDLNKSLDRRR